MERQCDRYTTPTTFSFCFDESDESSQSAVSRQKLPLSERDLEAKLSSTYHLLESATTSPYKFAICRETIFTLHGAVLNSGDIVIIHWLNSAFYDVSVYPLYTKWACSNATYTAPTRLNVFNLLSKITPDIYLIPNLGTNMGPIVIYPCLKTIMFDNLSTLLKNQSELLHEFQLLDGFIPSKPCDPDTLLHIDFSTLNPLTIAPVTVQLHNLTFITPADTIASISRRQENRPQTDISQFNCLHNHRHTPYLFELYPFLSNMPYPFTHSLPPALNPIAPVYPHHFSSAPLTIDSTLPTWVWPVQDAFFKTHIYTKKCFIIHSGGQRLQSIKTDLQGFQVKPLIETSSNSIIWMKTQPNEQPNTAIGQTYGERTMQYISSSPENAYAAYLAGNTIYFNPPDQIQAKYVKNLAIELGHNYGYTPSTNFLEVDDEVGYGFLDETGNFGGDLEIFAVNTQHSTPWHFDSQDNISIQLVGTKKWSVVKGVDQPLTNYHPKSTNKHSVISDKHLHQIARDGTGLSLPDLSDHQPPQYQNVTSLSLNNSMSYSNELKNGINWTSFDNHPDKEVFIVRPGSIFYHPAGTYHRVDALDDDGSLSINISLDPLRYSDVVLTQLSQLVMSHPVLRQRINSSTDNCAAILNNIFSTILPQIVNTLGHHDNSDPPTIASPKPPQVFIPALFSQNQIHDYPLSTILSQPPGPKNPLHSPLSALLYKDHGCLNLKQHLHIPLITVHSSLDSLFKITVPKIKPNKFVEKYYPQLVSVFSTTLSSEIPIPTQLDAIAATVNYHCRINYNPTVQLVSNEPSFVLPAPNDPTLPSSFSSLTPPTITTLPSFLDLSEKMSSYLHASSPNPVDITTLPCLFTNAQFQSATFHLFSLCHGISSHSTTSTIMSTATNTKSPPQFSIGVVFDLTKLSHTTPALPPQQFFSFNLLSRLFINQILFIHHFIFQKHLSLTTLQILHLIKLLSTITFEFINKITNSQLPVLPPDQQDQICLQSILLFINLVSLYTHCGFFKESYQ